MASYWQNLKKPLTNTGLMNTRLYSSGILNKSLNSGASNSQQIHVSTKNDYPQAEILPLPSNIDPSESMRFSPQRARDISSTAISTNIWNQRCIDITVDSSNYDVKPDADPHVNSYDCTGAVSLNSSMQSNVPSPFGGMHKFTHLNMPGGQWSQSNKWMSHDLHSSHYTNLRREVRKNMMDDGNKIGVSDEQGMIVLKNAYLHGLFASLTSLHPKSHSMVMKTSFACLSQIDYLKIGCSNSTSNRRMYSEKKVADKTTDQTNETQNKETQPITRAEDETVALTPRAKLKNAIRDYGSTVLVFHITISLVSLGIFYQLVSSGLDVVAVLNYLGLSSTTSTISNNVASGASTFVVAYAVHKIFAPFRISITLMSAPFIVRYLRNKGILSVKLAKKQ